MPYVLMLAGILTMCVPDDAGLLRFTIQGGIGLLIFISGVAVALERSETQS